MLTILGDRDRRQFCDGHSRRDFLKIGGLALGGLSLTDILRADSRPGAKRTHKAIIMVYLAGGPAHLDMFDLKPNAPVAADAFTFVPPKGADVMEDAPPKK